MKSLGSIAGILVLASQVLPQPFESKDDEGPCKQYTEWTTELVNGNLDRVHGYGSPTPTDFEQVDLRESWAKDNPHASFDSGAFASHHNEYGTERSCNWLGEEV